MRASIRERFSLPRLTPQVGNVKPPYGNGEEYVGSREAIYRRRFPENACIFFGVCTKGSLLRVSEIPAERVDLGWLRFTRKILKRTQFALGFLLFGDTYGNDEEHIGSREAICCRRSPRGLRLRSIGDTRTTVRFRLVKAHQQKAQGILVFFYIFKILFIVIKLCRLLKNCILSEQKNDIL